MTTANIDIAERLPHELEALWRFAFRLTGQADESNDLVQQTCLRALEQQHLYKEKGSLRSWLFRMERNLWLNQVNSREARDRRAANGRDSEAQIIDITNYYHPAEAVSGPEGELFLDQVYCMVKALPEDQRSVIELICVEGFSYRETAEILDIRMGTVMSRLARARLRIGRQMLKVDDRFVPGSQTNSEEKS